MSTSTTTRISAAALQHAFDALSQYTSGSARGGLAALDEAVVAATADRTAARELELRLLAVLKSGPPLEAQEYICRKLVLIGSQACVPGVAALLRDPATAHAARGVLEALPDPAAGDALRAALTTQTGLSRVGTIISLGMRRETASLDNLAPLLLSEDPPVASAAAGALAEIGNSRAAEVLRDFLPRAPETLRVALGDACLVCAERLTLAGETKQAAELYRSIEASNPMPHIRGAAASGLARLSAGA